MRNMCGGFHAADIRLHDQDEYLEGSMYGSWAWGSLSLRLEWATYKWRWGLGCDVLDKLAILVQIRVGVVFISVRFKKFP